MWSDDIEKQDGKINSQREKDKDHNDNIRKLSTGKHDRIHSCRNDARQEIKKMINTAAVPDSTIEIALPLGK